MKLYVVNMKSNRGTHQYILGVYSSKELAETEAKKQVEYRYEKYGYEILVTDLNLTLG